ncbi:hypothetical protein NKI95_20575 [Mesorhizobium sp. M0306]|uniref:hypothetical protein n=1 Tax=unclassified Mesorhizobium TaxID=325217 RepID=UPI00333D1EBC
MRTTHDAVPINYDWAGPIHCVPEHVPIFDHLRGHRNIFYGMGFKGTGIAPVALSASTGGWH